MHNMTKNSKPKNTSFNICIPRSRKKNYLIIMYHILTQLNNMTKHGKQQSLNHTKRVNNYSIVKQFKVYNRTFCYNISEANEAFLFSNECPILDRSTLIEMLTKCVLHCLNIIVLFYLCLWVCVLFVLVTSSCFKF